MAPDDVTGGIVIGADTPRLGVAAEAGALTGRPSIRPARARNAPAIDGRLDDAVWCDAARITEFVQMRPLDGAPATEDTEVYPDFSQIESDRPQIEVNQRFALFFPDLRPFFLEGAEIFSIGGPRDDGPHAQGAKLTGKVGSTTIGVMYANDEAAGAIDDTLDPTFEGSAQTFVGRVRYDLYSESHIGAIFTDREFLDSYSRAGGLDSNFRLGDTHSLTVRALGTQHRDLDGVDTTGYLVDASLRKRGRNLSYGISSYALSPDFKTDVGFVRRTDERRGFGNISYRWWPESWLINWGPRFSYARSYRFDGILQDENAQVGVNFSFAKNINLSANVNRDMERFGGPALFRVSQSWMDLPSLR